MLPVILVKNFLPKRKPKRRVVDFAKPKNFQQFNAMKGNNTGKTVGFQVFIHL